MPFPHSYSTYIHNIGYLEPFGHNTQRGRQTAIGICRLCYRGGVAVEPLESDWTVIEKLRHKHDPKWTRLCDLQPTGISWCRHFRSKYKDYREIHCVKFLRLLFLAVSEISKKIILWRWSRWQQRWHERHLQPTRSSWWHQLWWGCRYLPVLRLRKFVGCDI